MPDVEERPSKIRKVNHVPNSGNLVAVQATQRDSPRSDSHSDQPTNDPSIQEETIPVPDHDSDIIDLQPDESHHVDIVQGSVLSKSQLKKLRRKEQWEAGKEDRRLKRREKHKEKQARKAATRAELAAQATITDVNPSAADVTANKKGGKRPIQVPLGLVIDCDFNELMSEKEIISLGAQLTRCYSENRSAVYRSHLAISSWGGTLQERFEVALAKNHLGWKGVRFIPEDFVAAAEQLNTAMRSRDGGKVLGALQGSLTEGIPHGTSSTLPGSKISKPSEKPFPEPVVATQKPVMASEDLGSGNSGEETTDAVIETESHIESEPLRNGHNTKATPNSNPEPSTQDLPPPSLVYLTSDSPHTLTELSPYTSYIIGGLVDKNRHKGICYKKAAKLGIPTAKLPIGEYMTMQSRTVLAVNHVVEIMLRWLELGDWGEAFVRVIPKRKEAKLRADKIGRANSIDGQEEDSGDGEDNGDDDAAALQAQLDHDMKQ